MANRSLIQGAYNIARTRTKLNLAKTGNRLAVINNLVGGFNMFQGAMFQKDQQAREDARLALAMKEKEGQKYDEAAKRVIDSVGADYSLEETKAIHDKVMSGRNDYINGNDFEKIMSIKNLNNLAQQYKHAEEVKLDIAKNYNAQNFYDGWDLDPDAKSYLDIMNGDLLPEMKEDELGYNINGEWTTMNTVQSKIQGFLKPNDFIKEFSGVRKKWTDISSKMQYGQNTDFPVENVTSDMSAVIDELPFEKLKAITLTKMPGVKNTFMQNQYEKLTNPETNLSDLGITPDMIADSGVNVSDGISDQEAVDLLAELISPENEQLLKEELNRYFTLNIGNHFENTWRPSAVEGFRDRRNPYIPKEAIEVETSTGRRSYETIDEFILDVRNDENLTIEEKEELILDGIFRRGF